VFTHRNAWLGVALGLAIGFPLYGVIELLRYLQASLDFPLWLAGAVIALRALAILIAAPLATIVLSRGVDSRFVISSGFALSMLAFLWEAAGVTSGADFHTFVGAELLVGVGFGLTFAPLLLTVVSNVPRLIDVPFVVAMMNLLFVIASSFANALLNTVFNHRLQTHLSDLAGSVSLSRGVIQHAVQSGGPSVTHYLSALVSQQAAVLAFADVALCTAAVAAIAIPFALSLRSAQPAANLVASLSSPPVSERAVIDEGSLGAA
jgi:DHA2 family multidrug resistance protein